MKNNYNCKIREDVVVWNSSWEMFTFNVPLRTMAGDFQKIIKALQREFLSDISEWGVRVEENKKAITIYSTAFTVGDELISKDKVTEILDEYNDREVREYRHVVLLTTANGDVIPQEDIDYLTTLIDSTQLDEAEYNKLCDEMLGV